MKKKIFPRTSFSKFLLNDDEPNEQTFHFRYQKKLFFQTGWSSLKKSSNGQRSPFEAITIFLELNVGNKIPIFNLPGTFSSTRWTTTAEKVSKVRSPKFKRSHIFLVFTFSDFLFQSLHKRVDKSKNWNVEFLNNNKWAEIKVVVVLRVQSIEVSRSPQDSDLTPRSPRFIFWEVTQEAENSTRSSSRKFAKTRLRLALGYSSDLIRKLH